MSRYIDAEALKEKFINTDANGISLTIDRYALKCIEDAPTIDIVHCGECRYWHRYIDLITQGRCEASDVLHGFPSTPVNSTTEDFYCKYGERIDNE